MRPVRRQHARMSWPMLRTDSSRRRSSSSSNPIPALSTHYDPLHSLPPPPPSLPQPQPQPRRRRHSRRRVSARAVATAFAAVAATTTIAVPCAASSSLPSIDFGQLGNSAVVGSFAGLEPWTPTSQRSNNGMSSLLARTTNGTLFPLAESDPGGTIDALCEMPGLPARPTSLYAAGNFTSISGVSASNIARWQPLDGPGGTWNPLGPGLPGPVHALHCDASHQTVVAGGNFPGSLSIWNTTSLVWQDQPYPTLDGPVLGLAPGQSEDTTQVRGGFSVQLASPGAGGNSSASPITSALRPVSMAGATIGVSASGRGQARDLLCPQANDGDDGGTFLWPDGQPGTITIDFLRTVQVRALRLGNTFANGRGSRNFSLATSSGSDITPLTLIYADTAMGLNATCNTACPLTTNPTIPYQDFLLADAERSPTGTVDVTSLTVHIDSWIGAGPGLHLLQLLGPGATAHANRGYNRGVCNSTQAGAGSSASSVSTTGSHWRHRAYATGTNTTEAYLRSSSGGSITFNLDVQVEGNYTVYLIVPGCDNTGTCGSAAALSATVHFNSSSPDATAHIDAPGSTVQTTALYDGPISAPTARWTPSVTITVDDLSSSGSGATATLGRADAVLRNSSALPPAAIRGFGLLEANLYAPVLNSSVVTNVTTSPVDAASAGLGQLGLEAPSYVAAVAVAGEQVLVGGSFNGTTLANATTQANPFANLVVMVPPANVTSTSNASRYEALAMPGGGMNGPVSALLTADSGVFVGGNFTGTSDGKTKLAYVAHFNVDQNTWGVLDGGLPGPVSAVQALGPDGILVLGSFPQSPTGITTGSYAVWNLTTRAWEHQRALVSGSLQVALTPRSAAPPSLANSTYLAGQIDALAAQSAPGAVTLDSVPYNAIFPVLRPLNYTLQLASNSSSQAHFESSKTDYAKVIARWTAALKSPRRTIRTPEDEATPNELFSRALAAPSSSFPVGDMYAAAFWSGPHGDWMLLGGQFTSGNATNLGMYPLSNSDGGSSSSGSDSGSGDIAIGSMRVGSLQGLARYPPDPLGIVQSLAVVNDSVYVGFEGGVRQYNFTSESWEADIVPLGATEHKVIVRRIFLRPSTTTLIVAGEFDTAGSLPCSGICLLDTNEHRWTQAPGLSGNVTDISFAEDKANTLIVAGSLDVGGVHAALAGWHFGNLTWSAYGSIGSSTDQVPGPAAALAVDDFNPSRILVAGEASSGSSSSGSSDANGNSYVAMWTGTGFNVLDGGANNESAQLVRGTQISQLTVLPLSKSRSGTSGALESDRVLLICGTLQTAAYGLLGAMLYDGVSGWTPWLKTVAAPGSTSNAGVRALSYAATHALRFANNHHLSVGVVICISIFIGLGIVLLLIILALLLALILRRRLSHEPSPFAAISNSAANRAARRQAPNNVSNKSDGTLFSTLEAATERVLAIAPPGPGRMLSQQSARNLTPTTSHSGHSGKGGRNGPAVRLVPTPTSSRGDRVRREAALTPGEGEHVFFIGAAPVHSGYEHNEVETELGARGAHIKSWHGMPETYDPNSASGSSGSGSGHYQSSSAATVSQYGHSDSNHSGQQENLRGDVVHVLPGEMIASESQQDPAQGYRSSESSTAAAWRQNLPTHTVNVSDGTGSGNGYTSGYNTSSGYATGTGTGTEAQSTSVSGTGRGSSSDPPGRFSTSGYATHGSAPTSSGRGQGHQTSNSNDTGYLVSTDSGQLRLAPDIRTLLHPARDGGSSPNANGSGARQPDTDKSGHKASGEYSCGAVYSTDSSNPRVGPGFGAIGARFPSDESDAESDEDSGLQSVLHDASNDSSEHQDRAAQHFTAHARYDYQPSTPAELPLSAGQEVTILESSDLHWWLAQDSSGRTGVVPAGYLL